MDVNVHHVLPPDPARVDDRPETVGRPLLARKFPREHHDPSQHAGIVRRGVGQRRDVAFRNQHEMHRRDRIDVVEREHVVVLVHLPGRYLAPDDLAKNAVLHHASPWFPALARFRAPRHPFVDHPLQRLGVVAADHHRPLAHELEPHRGPSGDIV